MEASPLTDADIAALWENHALGCETPASLLNTVWLNNSLHFGLRGTTEQFNLRWGDVTLHIGSNGVEYLELNERQTKTPTGENLADVRSVSPSLMFATGPDKCPIKIFKCFAGKRPANFCHSDYPFYLALNTKSDIHALQNGLWFVRQRVGMNKLPKFLKTMAELAKLPGERRITNHSVRKHLVQKLRSHDVPPSEIMAMTGHKNIQSILNYSNVTAEQQQKCSNLLSAVPGGNEQPTHGKQLFGTTTATLASSTSTKQPLSLPESGPTKNVAHCLPHPPLPFTQNFQQQMSSSFSLQFFGGTFPHQELPFSQLN